MKLYILYFLLFACAYSCAKDKGELQVICTPPDTVSFTKDILPVFNAHCNTSGCHTASTMAGKLNLEPSVAYSSLMKPGSGYIDTLNPSYSVLYADMNSVSKPMPPEGKLDKCTLDLVLKWIQQKAKNN